MIIEKLESGLHIMCDFRHYQGLTKAGTRYYYSGKQLLTYKLYKLFTKDVSSLAIAEYCKSTGLNIGYFIALDILKARGVTTKRKHLLALILALHFS